MYIIKYLKKDKLIGQVVCNSLEETETKLESTNYYNLSDRYEIIDSTSSNTIEESEIHDPNDVMKNMFDGEDEMEGFDWTLED